MTEKYVEEKIYTQSDLDKAIVNMREAHEISTVNLNELVDIQQHKIDACINFIKVLMEG